VFVFTGIELVIVVPAELKPLLEALQAMEYSAFVEAVTFARVTERLQRIVILSERFKCLPSASFEDDKHEGTHEEAGICKLCRVRTTAVVENASICGWVLTMCLVEFCQFSAKAMHHS